ncbi:hypothetical protein TW95_gp1307 [Pandoravirus inopinatum]|uniref:Uncharacterized protein n=1 Tax=Pandoravirus inopinatum TaxID=1605721 RepID=A0A0B5JAP6_9VIRU|nr:hypothetical protein TW95_gp1307 [Pandoravirus inopinatum]AJF98041.1 hypothetical protein [Pandoravirus inopinatum]
MLSIGYKTRPVPYIAVGPLFVQTTRLPALLFFLVHCCGLCADGPNGQRWMMGGKGLRKYILKKKDNHHSDPSFFYLRWRRIRAKNTVPRVITVSQQRNKNEIKEGTPVGVSTTC